jgi:hypothetical protein
VEKPEHSTNLWKELSVPQEGIGRRYAYEKLRKLHQLDERLAS